MRAIIIEEERFTEVLDSMKLASLSCAERGGAPYGWPEDMQLSTRQILVDSIYRAMHFEFVRWAQSHGASCVKK